MKGQNGLSLIFSKERNAQMMIRRRAAHHWRGAVAWSVQQVMFEGVPGHGFEPTHQ